MSERSVQAYMIFENDDKGYDFGGKPTGFVRVRKDYSDIKLSGVVSNLKCDKKMGPYQLYVMCLERQNPIIFDVCRLELSNGSANIEKTIHDAGISVSDIHVAVVVDESVKTYFKCPLISYAENRIEWREALLQYKKKESITQRTESDANNEAIVQGKINEVRLDDDTDNSLIRRGDDNLENRDFEAIEKQTDESEIKYKETNNEESDDIKSDDIESNDTESNDTKIDEKHISDEDNEIRDTKLDISKLIACFNESFQSVQPFGNRRNDYSWWKVLNPVQLNNLLFKCGIKCSLLFNSYVMAAHYKYKYLLAGLFISSMKEKSYFVCGVPGTYMRDRSPFGDLCRWVPIAGQRALPGMQGFWLIYIDPETGRLLKFE